MRELEERIALEKLQKLTKVEDEIKGKELKFSECACQKTKHNESIPTFIVLFYIFTFSCNSETIVMFPC